MQNAILNTQLQLHDDIANNPPPKVFKQYWKYTISISNCLVTKFASRENNRKVIFYFAGYNDYFFHYHLVKRYNKYDFIVIDLPGFGFNKWYNPEDDAKARYAQSINYNFFNNTDKLYKKLTKVFNFFASQYKQYYLFGLSTGGFIITSYLYKNEINRKCKIKFNKCILNSPFMKLYTEPAYMLRIINIFSKVTSIFTDKFDIQALSPSSNTEYINAINDCLQNIHSQQQYRSIEKQHMEICYKPEFSPCKYNSWINTINSESELMKNSTIKVTVPSILVCSTSYRNTTGYYNYDEAINPLDAVDCITKIMTNLQVHMYKSGHDVTLEPFNDGDNINFETIFDPIFR